MKAGKGVGVMNGGSSAGADNLQPMQPPERSQHGSLDLQTFSNHLFGPPPLMLHNSFLQSQSQAKNANLHEPKTSTPTSTVHKMWGRENLKHPSHTSIVHKMWGGKNLKNSPYACIVHRMWGRKSLRHEISSIR